MARLPVSATRKEGIELDTRRDKLPALKHKVRDIDDRMDDIVFNAIDYIQERLRDGELRMFYFNLMSERDYDNRDFEDLIAFICDLMDISLQEGRFDRVDDAIQAVVQDVIDVHVADMAEQHRELMTYVGRQQVRSVEEAADMYSKYVKAVDMYRRNGGSLPRSSGGRGRRDERDDRDDDRDRSSRRSSSRANYGDDDDDRDRPRSNTRRDRHNRDAIRDGVRASPRRKENGALDPTSRYEDALGVHNTNGKNTLDDEDRRSRRNRDDDRDDRPARDRQWKDDDQASSENTRVQRLPGSSRNNDIEDALEREQQSTKESNTTMSTANLTIDQAEKHLLSAKANPDVWLPTIKFPHPLAFTPYDALYYQIDKQLKAVVPVLVKKDTPMNYYDHESIAFGATPKHMARFTDADVQKRLGQLSDAIKNEHADYLVPGEEKPRKYVKRLDHTGFTIFSSSIKGALTAMVQRRLATEAQQPVGDVLQEVSIAHGRAYVIEQFPARMDEHLMLEEMRNCKTFTKLAEHIVSLSKSGRQSLALELDRYVTRAVNHMLVQYMSIRGVRIGSFVDDWLDLFELVTRDYGTGFRDAITLNQKNIIGLIFGNVDGAQDWVDAHITADARHPSVRVFVCANCVDVAEVNELSYNLGIDMVKGIASEVLPEVNPFFHELAKLVNTNYHNEFRRSFIRTSDGVVLEVSKSFISDSALLVRLVNQR